MLKETIRKEMRGAIDKYNNAQKEAKQAYEYLRELKQAASDLELKVDAMVSNAAFEIINRPEPEVVQFKHVRPRGEAIDFGGATGF